MPKSIFREMCSLRIHEPITLNFPPHLHENIEIILVTKGTCDVYCDGKHYLLNPGDLFLAFPHQIHHFENHTVSHDGVGFCFSIPPNTLSFYDELVWNRNPVSAVSHPENFEQIFELLKITNKLFSDNADRSVIVGLANAVFSLIIPNYTLTYATHSNDTVAKVIDYCRAHYRENISVADVSKTLFMSAGTVSRIFSKKIHLSFCDYINSLRISTFLQLMQDEKHISITEAATAAGFSTIRTFNEAFKKLYGITPSKYLRVDKTPTIELTYKKKKS